uniref:Uncharacterized protein n=1 Tax=Avena sativa TaxID=4498 RepID=A0ACD5XFZ4_AVESA
MGAACEGAGCGWRLGTRRIDPTFESNSSLATEILSSNLSMDARHITLCFLLVLVINADLTSATECRRFVDWSPFCSKWLCKVQCELEAQSTSCYVQSYHCKGSFFKSGACVCQMCRD